MDEIISIEINDLIDYGSLEEVIRHKFLTVFNDSSIIIINPINGFLGRINSKGILKWDDHSSVELIVPSLTRAGEVPDSFMKMLEGLKIHNYHTNMDEWNEIFTQIKILYGGINKLCDN